MIEDQMLQDALTRLLPFRVTSTSLNVKQRAMETASAALSEEYVFTTVFDPLPQLHVDTLGYGEVFDSLYVTTPIQNIVDDSFDFNTNPIFSIQTTTNTPNTYVYEKASQLTENTLQMNHEPLNSLVIVTDFGVITTDVLSVTGTGPYVVTTATPIPPTVILNVGYQLAEPLTLIMLAGFLRVVNENHYVQTTGIEYGFDTRGAYIGSSIAIDGNQYNVTSVTFDDIPEIAHVVVGSMIVNPVATEMAFDVNGYGGSAST